MKKSTVHFFSILFLLFFGIKFNAQNNNDVVKAKIVLEDVEGNIKITGTAENLSDIIQSMSYRLTVIKKNNKSTNSSNNSQEGLFTLAPNESKNLSTTQINKSNDDEIIILLLFYDENKQIVSKDRVVINEEKKKM